MLHAVSGDSDDSWGDDFASETYTGAEFDGVGEEEDNDGLDLAADERHERRPTDGRIDAERIPLHLPSNIGRSWCDGNSGKDLVEAELRLREGKLNDSLGHIRIALGHKSYLFRNNVRPARTQRLKTRAWTEVHAVESTVQHHARVYNRARQSIENLGANASLLNRYKVLGRQDLKIDTAVIAPNVRGQRNKSLPWFWSMDVERDAGVGTWMNDCKHIPFYTHYDGHSSSKFNAVYRVHWLRAKAQKTRWIEELQCLQVEMESAIRFFQFQEKSWQEKRGLIEPRSQPGHASWAARQSAMWNSMATQARSTFNDLLKSHPPPDFAKVVRPSSDGLPSYS